MKKILIPFLMLFLPQLLLAAEELKVSVSTPHPGYGIEIQRIDASGDQYFVLVSVKLPDPGTMYPMMISSAEDRVHVETAPKQVTVILLKRPWGWGEELSVENEAEYLKHAKGSQSIPFTRKPNSTK